MSAYQDIEKHGKILYTASGSPKACISNAALIYSHHPEWVGKIGFDTFSIRVIKHDKLPSGSLPGVWNDVDCTRAMIWLSDNFGFSMSESATQRIFEFIADNNQFSPVVDYLDSLVWDGVKRVDSWLEVYFGVASSPAVDIFQRATLIGAVARAVEPGCKNDTMLVIEGKQGIGKSSAISALAGKDWFSDAPFEPGSVNSYLGMRGKWIIEWSEMAASKAVDIQRIRAFLSQIRDEYRAPYARNVIDVPRQCVFMGTVNDSTYLTDSTGNRRFMPVAATQVDVQGIADDRDQIWAETYDLYKQGVKWWFESDNEHVLNAQESRFESDPWEDLVIDYISTLVETKVHSDTLCEGIGLDVTKLNRKDYSRIKQIMERLDWKTGRPYIDGLQKRGFSKPAPLSETMFDGISF